MEKVVRTKSNLYLRHHPEFGTVIFSPFSGLFFAVSAKESENVNKFCNNLDNELPQSIKEHLEIGQNIEKKEIFKIRQWLPTKGDFSDYNELPEQPIAINWLISNECNFNCAYCYAGDIIDRKFNSVEIAETGKKLLSLNPLAIILTGGEPLMQPKKLEEALNVLGGKAGLFLDTNGLLFNERITDLLALHKVVVRVSLDSFQNKINNRIRPLKKNKQQINIVERIVNNIQRYQSSGITVIIHSVLSTMNRQCLEDMYQQLPRLKVHGWRIFLVADPNDDAKNKSFDLLMKQGNRLTIEEARNRLEKEINFFQKKFLSQPEFYIQILKHTNSKKNSVFLAMPDGTLMTECIFQSKKTELNVNNLFKKIDIISHYERYLGPI